MITHDELIDRVWGDNRVISSDNLSQRLKMVRQALGDSVDKPLYIESVRGEGVRLIPAVTRVSTEPEAGAPPAAASPAKFTLGNKFVALAALILLFVVIGSQLMPGDERDVVTAGQPLARDNNGVELHQPAMENPGAYLNGLQVEQHDDYPRVVDQSKSLLSIAVLPLKNESPDPNNAFYAAGIHEEILSQLSRLKGFSVISRTSVLRYAETTKSIPEIAAELLVENIIEGSVRYEGNRMRVYIQLLDGSSDTHVWSKTYEGELQDIFTFESDIALDIATTLSRTLSADEVERLNVTPTTSLEAYGEYVLGRQALAARSPASLKEAMARFERACELDPNYALAWVGQADAWLMLEEYSDVKLNDTFAPRQRAIERALELDPTLGEAWVSRAMLRMHQRRNAEAEEYFSYGLQLIPGNAQAHHHYSHFLAYHVGRPHMGLAELRIALALNPQAPELQSMLGDLLYLVGQPEEAMESTLEAIRRTPDFSYFYFLMSWRQSQLGNLAAAAHWAHAGAQLPSPVAPVLTQQCISLRNLGDDEASEKCSAILYAKGAKMNNDHPTDLHTALLYAPPHPRGLPNYILEFVSAGRPELALDLMTSLAPNYFGAEDVSVHPAWVGAAALSGILLSQAGETARGNYLMDEALNTMRTMDRTQGYGYAIYDIAIYAYRVEREHAVSALRAAIDSGWREHWRALRGEAFAVMSETPEWLALVAEVEADIVDQRALYERHRNDTIWTDFQPVKWRQDTDKLVGSSR